MKTIKNLTLGLSTTLLTISCYSQGNELQINALSGCEIQDSLSVTLTQNLNFDNVYFDQEIKIIRPHGSDNIYKKNTLNAFKSSEYSNALSTTIESNNFNENDELNRENVLLDLNSQVFNEVEYSFGKKKENKEPFFTNKRNLYSSLWAFSSLNYIYADLLGLMDVHVLSQYQTGVVDGINITPNFLAVAAGFMQIPIANVFLPHIIKNDKALRWVQIASGTVMTLVQTGTLFMGKPTPYYALFSAFEIAATTFITIDALKWKAKSTKRKKIID